jgi:hypothetical protein
VLFLADFSKVSARNQQGDSKGAARGKQGESNDIETQNFAFFGGEGPIQNEE